MVQGWYRDGTRMVQGWYRDGTGVIQEQFSISYNRHTIFEAMPSSLDLLQQRASFINAVHF